MSFGLKKSALMGKFPRGYMSSILPTFFVDSRMCVEFFRVAFTVREEVQTVREDLIRHAQVTILDYVSVERADRAEDKNQILEELCYLACVIYDANLEF